MIIDISWRGIEDVVLVMYVLSVIVKEYSHATLILIIIMSISVITWVSVIVLINVVITIPHINILLITLGKGITHQEKKRVVHPSIYIGKMDGWKHPHHPRESLRGCRVWCWMSR